MANINAPRGFVPKRHLDGSPYNGQYQIFLVPSTDGTALFVGDVVKSLGSAGAAGTIVNGMDMEGVETVGKNTTSPIIAGTDIRGVVVGFLPDPTDKAATRYRLALTNRVALVVSDPTCVFEVQEDAATTPIAAASIGLNATIVPGTGNTVTGTSTSQIASSTVATTATFPVRILGLAKRPDNAFNVGGAGTDPAKFEVIFNATGVATGGVGVLGTA